MKLDRILGFAVGPIGAAVIGLVSVPTIALLFTPADVGRLNVFQVSVSFGLLLSVLGLDQAYGREYHETPARAQLLRACFLPGFVLLLGLSVLVLPFASSLASRLYGIPEPRLIFLTIGACLIAYVSRFLSLILRMQERGWAYSASQVLPKVLSLLLLLCVPVFAWKRAFSTLQGIVIMGLLAVMLVYAWNTRFDWLEAARTKLDKNEVRRLLAFGLPLVFSGLAYWGLAGTSTFALRQWSSLDELAIYSVTQGFAGAALIFQSIFATVWAPTVYKWVADGVDMRRVDNVARHALVVVCAVFVGIGLFSWLTDYVLPEHYRSVKYLLGLAIAPSLLYTLSVVTAIGINISRRTRWTVWITCASLFANLLLSWCWVPRYGATGAVLANGVAFFVFFVLRTEVSAALWRPFPRAKLYVVLAGLLTVASAIAAAGSQLPPAYPVAWLAVLLLVIMMLQQESKDLIALMKRHLPGASK